MIVYYLSAHGFGHAVRACEVIRCLPPGLPVTIRTMAPEWFLREELGERPFALAPAELDCGVLGPDSNQIDMAATVTAMEKLQDANDRRLAEEVRWLRSIGARVVVSDVTPFGLRAAREAGIPSILIANFTWVGIYEYALAHADPSPDLISRAGKLIQRMQADYDQGDLLLATDMAIPIRACRARRGVPLVARRGTNRRERLIQALGLDPQLPVYLLYLGREGMDEIRWDRFRALGPLQLVSFNPPRGQERRIRAIPHGLIAHADVAASVDGIVAKTGYGICGEAVACGTRLLYPPRLGFAEYAAAHELMTRWGGGLEIPERDFRDLAWAPWLERLNRLTPNPNAVATDGGTVCAQWILDAYQRGCAD